MKNKGPKKKGQIKTGKKREKKRIKKARKSDKLQASFGQGGKFKTRHAVE